MLRKIFAGAGGPFTNKLTNCERIRIHVDGQIEFEYAMCGHGNFLICKEKFVDSKNIWIYRIILRISPGAYIFQWPFLRGLFLEGLIFGGVYLRREICVSKSIGLAI